MTAGAVQGASTGTSLAGAVALVTGAGSGLGRATARVLCEAGAAVVAADIRFDAAQATIDEVDGAARSLAVTLDVRDPDSARAAVAAAVEQLGRLDVLVNNAGTDVTKDFAEMTPEEWRRVLEVNLHGPMLMSQAALPALRDSGRGQIVNIASTAAKRAWTEATAYHASKWGLLGFSHSLHAEARRYGVRVSAVVAGGMRTPFILERFPDTPLENLLDPRRVAETIRFVLERPQDTVIPEVMVLPIRETSWP
jgi:NAD(P)-dependent dehydrogenase (short-subunit alcohol dehydrogenase family)